MEAARRAVVADVPAIEDLARAAIAEAEAQRGGPVWRQHQGRREPLLERLTDEVGRSDEHGCAVVGLIEDAVVGYGVSHLELLADGTILSVVDDLYVDPGARGVGIGEAMMDLLVAHATEAGARGIDALALPGDRETKNFFETFGLKARAIVVHRDLQGEGERA